MDTQVFKTSAEHLPHPEPLLEVPPYSDITLEALVESSALPPPPQLKFQNSFLQFTK